MIITNRPPATSATQFLISRTTRLRAWARSADPYMLIAGVALALIILGSVAQQWIAPLLRPSPAPIILVATPTPGAGGATHDLMIKRPARAAAPAIDASEAGDAPGAAVLAAPSEAPTSASGYTAQTDQGALFVPDDATPVPTGQPYSGPFLAPAPPSPAGQRLCGPPGFGDWRDYDPMYAGSPVCQEGAP